MTDALTLPQSTDRWRGALLGTALGDAAGRPFEGRHHIGADQVEAWLADDAELVWSDDTAMTIALARSLIARTGQVDAQHLGDTFATEYHQEPWRGYGAGPPRIFATAAAGTPYLEAAAALFGGTGSFGNGAAMRAAPVAVAGGDDPDRVASLARQQAMVTHAHTLGQDGAALLALAVWALATWPHDDPARTIGATLRHLDTDEMRSAAATALDLGPDASATSIARRLGNGVAAVEAVPAAIAAFLGAAGDAHDVLVRAVTVGGDTDTIAAMAGAMAGAQLGADALPPPLLARLEARDELIGLADTLTHVTRR